MKKTSLHDGHRDRLREKFIRHGLSSLEPHEVNVSLVKNMVGTTGFTAL